MLADRIVARLNVDRTVEGAKRVLGELFDREEFSFQDFLHRYIPELAQKKFINSLLFECYYDSVDPVLNSSTPLYYLLILAAESLTMTDLKKIGSELSLDRLTRLLACGSRHYREGAWLWEQYCLCGNRSEGVKRLATALQRRCYTPEALFNLLGEREIESEDELKALLSVLEKEIEEHAHHLKKAYEEMVDAFINAPYKVSDLFIRKNESFTAAAKADMERAKSQAQVNSEKTRTLFQGYLDDPFTVQEWKKFSQLFGSFGHMPPIVADAKEAIFEPLLAKIEEIKRLYNAPQELVMCHADELKFYLSFAQAIDRHLRAINRTPSDYVEGLKNMAIAMATKGKELRRQAWLPAIVTHLSTIDSEIAKLDFADHPIFIFDQSTPDRFTDNGLFIEEQSKKGPFVIFHLSLEEIKALSKKIGVEPLLFMDDDMGFGGARNALFLIAPVLKRLYDKGYRTFDAWMEANSVLIREAIDKGCLGKSDKPNVCAALALHMGDDDTMVPLSNFLADMLLSKNKADFYFANQSFYYGRCSTHFMGVWPLAEVLEHPDSAYMSSRWHNETFPCSFAGHLGKPCLCFNLPSGNEEGQFQVRKLCVDPLRHALIHLGGARYPVDIDLAFHPLVGISQHLAAMIPYAFGTQSITSLLDPMDRLGRAALSWNRLEYRDKHIFTNFGSVMTSLSDEMIEHQVQRFFWQNVDEWIGTGELSMPQPLRSYLKTLLESDVDASIGEYIKSGEVDAKALADEFDAIRKLYDDFKSDAILLNDFIHAVKGDIKAALEGPTDEKPWFWLCPTADIDLEGIIDGARQKTERQHNRSFQDSPMTYGIYLLVKVVGCGTFFKNLRDWDEGPKRPKARL